MTKNLLDLVAFLQQEGRLLRQSAKGESDAAIKNAAAGAFEDAAEYVQRFQDGDVTFIKVKATVTTSTSEGASTADWDLKRRTCELCGKVLKTAYGKTNHQNACGKTPQLTGAIRAGMKTLQASKGSEEDSWSSPPSAPPRPPQSFVLDRFSSTHDWNKRSLVTERGGFDWYRCTRCGADGKRFGISNSISLTKGKKICPKAITQEE